MRCRNVDAVLCSVQTGTQESQASRSRSLRVRMGVVAPPAIVSGTTYLVSSENRAKSRFRPNRAGESFRFQWLICTL